MSDNSWKKIEAPVPGTAQENAGTPASVETADLPRLPDLPPEEQPLPLPAEEAVAGKADAPISSTDWLSVPGEPVSPEESAIRSPVRYTKRGRRKGRYKFAAPLGLLVILLSLAGLVFLGYLGVRAIQRSQDDTTLRQELMDYFDPVIQYMPTPFEDINDSSQSALLEAAIWKVTEAERIRQLQEKDENSAYPYDDQGRMIIPLKEITEAYASLFGPDAEPELETIGEPGLSFTVEYFQEEKAYHVPYASSSSNYVPVLDTLKKKDGDYILRVGYVPGMDIAVDNKGNLIDPTPDQAEYFQLYRVRKTGDGWMLVSVSKDS